MNRRKESQPGESGQALIVFTVLIAVFLAFCALVVDVGRMYAERRYMQNAADAGSLAASGLIAANLKPCDDNSQAVCTDLRKNEVIDRVRAAVDANASLLGGYTAPIDIVVQYKRFDYTLGRCPTSAWASADVLVSSTDVMPFDTCKVRVTPTSQWTTWFPMVAGSSFSKRPGSAGASATAMIVGDNSLTPRGDVWPMVRRRSAMNPYSENPDRAYPFQFWSSSAANHLDDAGNNWKELVNLGYNSLRRDSETTGYSPKWTPRIQAITGAELHKSNPTANDSWNDTRWFGLDLPNKSGNGGVYWNTNANQATSTSNYTEAFYQQDGENWFDYGFGGKLSLTKDWSGYACSSAGLPCNLPSLSDLQQGWHVPSVANIDYDLSVTGHNSDTLNASWWVNGGNGKGDWVETYSGQGYGSGDIGNNVHSQIMEYIARNGRTDLDTCPYYARWGKCVLIAVYLWEGGQMYYPMGSGSSFTSWIPWSGLSGNKANGRGVPDRVHLVDFWYFAFYQGIANTYPTSEIDGFFMAKSKPGEPPTFTVPPSNRYNYYFIVGE